MAEITAAAVKSLREQTGLPMMDCKRALTETGGDVDRPHRVFAQGGQGQDGRRSAPAAKRPSGGWRFSPASSRPVGTMIELRCETAPVATNEEFMQLANDLAEQLATGPGATTPEALLGRSHRRASPATRSASSSTT